LKKKDKIFLNILTLQKKIMVNLQINDSSKNAKELINYLKVLPFVKFEEKNDYNSKFVEKVLKASKGKTTKFDDNKTIWENLKLK
jgi:hypothetical protein